MILSSFSLFSLFLPFSISLLFYCIFFFCTLLVLFNLFSQNFLFSLCRIMTDCYKQTTTTSINKLQRQQQQRRNSSPECLSSFNTATIDKKLSSSNNTIVNNSKFNHQVKYISRLSSPFQFISSSD